jgi:hypothetical protein
VYAVFEALDKVENLLEGKEFFIGNQLTEADIRLWVTIVQFFLHRVASVFAILTLHCRPRSASIQSTSGISNATSVISAMDIRTSTGSPPSYIPGACGLIVAQVDEGIVLEKSCVQGLHEL